MIVAKADGTPWPIEDAAEKLMLRAALPGARVFDLAAEGLRKAKATGVPAMDRLALALPASWCVNSPAPSTVLRRWALAPLNEVWMALIDVLEEPRQGALGAEAVEALLMGIRALGDEPFVVEAASKVLAALTPEVVPLMPGPARSFVLGGDAPGDARSFVAIVDWFAEAVRRGHDDLAHHARTHTEVPLSPAQVLDRLLWFDSEGHRHFPGKRDVPAGSAAASEGSRP
jgi:hypothetical protein